MRDKLTPRYAVGCKRPGFPQHLSVDVQPRQRRLVTEPIDKITGSGVATADGETHDVDVLILATGFKVMDPDGVLTYPLTGSERPVAGPVLGRAPAAGLRGRQHPGLPELLHASSGPYGYVGSSYFALIESQSHHIVRCLKHADAAAPPASR